MMSEHTDEKVGFPQLPTPHCPNSSYRGWRADEDKGRKGNQSKEIMEGWGGLECLLGHTPRPSRRVFLNLAIEFLETITNFFENSYQRITNAVLTSSKSRCRFRKCCKPRLKAASTAATSVRHVSLRIHKDTGKKVQATLW